MHVSQIHVVNFMTHSDSTLELPIGVTCVSGPNGSGKSGITNEAMSAALWGKTSRGSPPWHRDHDCSVVVNLSDAYVARAMSPSGRGSLSWNLIGHPPKEYESVTHAQAALEKHVGSMAEWRRCAVFASSDAALFTTSTDAERKRLLEGVLGIDRFDTALDACRADMKKEQAFLARMVSDVGNIQASVATAEKWREDATRGLASLVVAPAPDESRLPRAQKLMEAVMVEHSSVLRDIDACSARGGGSAAEIRELERKSHMLSGGQCPTCEQLIPVDLRDRIGTRLSQVRVEAARQSERIQMETAEFRERANEFAEDIASLREKIQRIRMDSEAHRMSANEHARWRRTLDKAESDLKVHAEALEAKRMLLSEREGMIVELDAVEKVLGLRGVRALLVGRALAGIEELGNVWLERMVGSGASIRLKGQTERKSGDVVDVISFEVEGYGGGYGYVGASTGQRRRIDVAMLFALGEVAAAARGLSPGTMFLDEVADSLDAEGQAAVVDCLGEISQNRSVVVISHRPEFVEMLNPVRHYRVDGGCVGRLV